MRVFYVLSDLDDWIELAKNMQHELDWEPVYWLSTKKLTAPLQQMFSSLHIDDFVKINQGKLPSTALLFPLDEAVIHHYLKYEHNALDMMRRLDPDGKSFSYEEKVQLYYKHLSYALSLFKQYKPQRILFNESPHSPFSYILYAVAKEQNISIIRFSPTHIDARVLVSSTIEKTSPYFRAYLHESLRQTSSLDPQLQSYIENLQADYSTALPKYMQSIIHKPSLFSRLKNNTKKALRFLQTPPDLYFHTNSVLFHSRFKGLWFIFNKIKGDLFKRKLLKAYKKEIKPLDLSRPYIYVPLHYQPEKTTNPEGGVYYDQLLMITLLSQTLPKEYTLIVKEHPSQFSSQLEGERGRDLQIYQKLSALTNVTLAPLSYNSFELIDAAKAVAVVTGTAALESIMRSKHALIFGSVWFQECEGILQCKTKEDVKQAFIHIQNSTVKQKEIVSFFKTLELYSLPAYLNPGNKPYTPISEKKNVENLTQLLLQYEKNLYGD